MKVLNLDDLQRVMTQGCSAPDCDHKDHSNLDNGRLFLHPRCHPTGIEASIQIDEDFIRIQCVECHDEIVTIRIAKKP